MASQPPTRTKFYKNKRQGKVMGVCAGIADYTGLDVTLVRIAFVVALLMSSFSILPVYFIAGWIADDTPREVALESADERRFWQGVRQSPARTARDIRARFREIDRRLADVESYTLSANRSLANEIERLR
jgi:phage shock protein C